MRLGIISDIHANYEALCSVVESLRHDKVDACYCLGDTVGYGGAPNECADLVQATARATILGNHDAAVAGLMDYSYYYEAARQALDSHAQQLTRKNLDWLRGLPYTIKLKEEDVDLCHGSPVRLEEFEYIFAPEQARECLPIYDELCSLVLIGHSHLCKVFELKPDSVTERPAKNFKLEPGSKYIISVGSVGQPRDCDNRASYVVFDTVSREFEFHRVEYDVETAASRILNSALERNFAHRLYLGL